MTTENGYPANNGKDAGATLDRPALMAAARAWWHRKMPRSNFKSATIKGNGRVDVHWEDHDDSGTYTLPVEFATLPAERLLTGQGCELPPEGWWCSREPGHEGPCAARENGPADTILTWYRGLPDTAKQSLSLRDLHNLARSLAASRLESAR